MTIDYQLKGLNPHLWQDLDDLTRNKYEEEYILVSDSTPDILVKLGMPNAPIYIPCGKIKMGLMTGDTYKHGHCNEIGKASLSRALQHLGDPLAVNNPEDGAYGVYLEDKASTGKPMYVFFRVDKSKNVNIMVSAYGRVAMTDETFVYIDDTKLKSRWDSNNYLVQKFKGKLEDEVYKGKTPTKTSIKKMASRDLI